MNEVTKMIEKGASFVTQTLRGNFAHLPFAPKAPEDRNEYGPSLIAATIVFSDVELLRMMSDKQYATTTVASKSKLIQAVLENKTPRNYDNLGFYVREPTDVDRQLVKQWVVAIFPLNDLDEIAGYDEFHLYEEEVRNLKRQLEKNAE